MWHVRLADAPDESMLSLTEKGRARTFAHPTLRRRYVSTRNAIRRLLATYTGRPPGSLDFATDPKGKPHLSDGQGLAFNLSHSGDDLMLAVAHGSPVGIDLETATQPAPLETARIVFSREEQAWLGQIPGPAQSAAFLWIWTRKEALLKGVGAGFLMDPQTINVLGASPLPGWHLHDLTDFTGCPAALATLIPDARIRCFRGASDSSFTREPAPGTL